MSWIDPEFLYFPLSNLKTFSDVRSLSFIRWDAILFRGASLEPYFGHFGKSLRAVSLQSCDLDAAILFNLLSFLPNVDDIEIERPLPCTKEPDIILDARKVTPNFRGTLSLTDFSSTVPILEAITTLPLHFSTIRIKGCSSKELSAYQLLLACCVDTLITFHYEQFHEVLILPKVSLASCNELQEVHVLFLGSAQHRRPTEIPLSSITSKELRKISLTFIENDGPVRENETGRDEDEDEWGVWSTGPTPWDSWDTMLSRVAHNVRGKLILQLNVQRAGAKPAKLDRLLPKFLKHGGLVDINCS
ncbi:hypothetical protein BJ322DRAFT_1113406 [Thelephora terrestris]|uniref:Uncharacterized protein n=1 Tax=Thelephora terrestris TaxID=56493 RepID=A0A9P6L2D5_9AGAM|nr:hypothetical protein BJ322DRAFT_1113406 [Thelephora terrestris]